MICLSLFVQWIAQVGVTYFWSQRFRGSSIFLKYLMKLRYTLHAPSKERSCFMSYQNLVSVMVEVESLAMSMRPKRSTLPR